MPAASGQLPAASAVLSEREGGDTLLLFFCGGIHPFAKSATRAGRRARAIMILIEPPIQAKFGRALRPRALGAFLREAAQAARLKGDVSVLLAGDAEIQRLNREFRKKDKATDVLSFPATHPVAKNGRQEWGTRAPEESSAGDLAVSVETAARQAEDAGHALFVELQILVLHGVLHLAGYDHETDEGEMARKEAALRKRFGLEMGLIERSEPTLSPKAGDKSGAPRSRGNGR